MERNQRNKEKGNGEGTIYTNKKTGLLIGQYTVGGKRKSVYQKKNEKTTDFKKRFNAILTSVNNGTYIEKSNQTFIDILKKHVEQKNLDGITSDSSYVRDINTVKAIEKTCNNFINKPIQKIQVEDLIEAKKNIRKYAQTTVDKIWIFIKKTFEIAISRRLIVFDITKDEALKKPFSEKEKKKIQALTKKEQNKLESILDNEERKHKYRNIVRLQLETGMRIGETLARAKDNINKKNNTFLINNTLTKDKDGNIILGKHTKTYNRNTGEDSGARIWKMNSVIKEIAFEQLSQKITNIHGLLFWDYENNTFISYQEINAWLRRINEKYKITKKSLATHVLRHSAIQRMREAGMDMKVIQYLVGHVEGSKMTDDVYTDITDEFVEQELKKLS